MNIKILVADDHDVVRSGIHWILRKHKNMKIVGETDNGFEAVSLAEKLKPDVVLMDITMPRMSGIIATREIMSKAGKTKIIALSMHLDEEQVKEMIEAGAAGYLVKSRVYVELLDAIHTVLAGRLYLSPAISNVFVKGCAGSEHETTEPAVFNLTDREKQVLKCVAEGKITKEIAEELHISFKTVETYRHDIMAKCALHSIAELTKYAVRAGITTP